MVMFRCRTCEKECILEFGRQTGDFWCDPECRQRFSEVVACLEKDEPIDIDYRSRLFCEAFKEVAAHRRAERVYARDVREREWQRSRPPPMRPLYPC
jgi:hypothetical protein